MVSVILSRHKNVLINTINPSTKCISLNRHLKRGHKQIVSIQKYWSQLNIGFSKTIKIYKCTAKYYQLQHCKQANTSHRDIRSRKMSNHHSRLLPQYPFVILPHWKERTRYTCIDIFWICNDVWIYPAVDL